MTSPEKIDGREDEESSAPVEIAAGDIHAEDAVPAPSMDETRPDGAAEDDLEAPLTLMNEGSVDRDLLQSLFALDVREADLSDAKDSGDPVENRIAPENAKPQKKVSEEVTQEQTESFLKLADTLSADIVEVAPRRRGISRFLNLVKRREKAPSASLDIPVSFAPIDAGLVVSVTEDDAFGPSLVSVDILDQAPQKAVAIADVSEADVVQAVEPAETVDAAETVEAFETIVLPLGEPDDGFETVKLIKRQNQFEDPSLVKWAADAEDVSRDATASSGEDIPDSAPEAPPVVPRTTPRRVDPRPVAPEPDAFVQMQADAGPATSIPAVKAIEPKKTTERKRKAPRRGAPPIQVLIGWIGESSRKDVVEHAKGFAEDHLETLESAWVTLEPFREGWIFEIHEGGAGSAYLPEIIDQLSRDPDQVVWIPSGTALNRVMTVRISEGQVFATILTESESALVRKSGQVPLERTGRMKRLLPKGNLALALGASMAAVATISLIGTFQYSIMIDQQPLPSRSFNAETLPHSQIIRLADGISENRWVSRIIFQDGQWRADFEEVAPVILPVDDAGARSVIQDIYDQEDRIQQNVLETIKRETSQ